MSKVIESYLTEIYDPALEVSEMGIAVGILGANLAVVGAAMLYQKAHEYANKIRERKGKPLKYTKAERMKMAEEEEAKRKSAEAAKKKMEEHKNEVMEYQKQIQKAYGINVTPLGENVLSGHEQIYRSICSDVKMWLTKLKNNKLYVAAIQKVIDSLKNDPDVGSDYKQFTPRMFLNDIDFDTDTIDEDDTYITYTIDIGQCSNIMAEADIFDVIAKDIMQMIEIKYINYKVSVWQKDIGFGWFYVDIDK